MPIGSTIAWPRLLSALSAAGLLLSACTVPRYAVGTAEGKDAIMDAVNLALTQGACTSAVTQIEPLYASPQTDNQVRALRASAHGCFLGINFFGLLNDIATRPLTGTSFWTTTAALFYSNDLTLLDKRIAAGAAATDALMAMVLPGAFVPASQQVDHDGDGLNVGTIIPADRTLDSSMYLIMTSMATISALQNRYSQTDPTTFKQVQPLGYTPARTAGWAVPTNFVTEEGCEFAAAILNFVDSNDQIVAANPGGNFAGALGAMNSGLKLLLTDACNAGCHAMAAGTGSVTGIDFSATTCALGADTCNDDTSRPCPLTLRDRSRCTALATDRNTCAAAGIAIMVNDDTVGWSN